MGLKNVIWGFEGHMTKLSLNQFDSHTGALPPPAPLMRFTLEPACRGHPALAPPLEEGGWYPTGTPGWDCRHPGTHLSPIFSRGPQGVGKSWTGTEETLDKSRLVLTLPIYKLGELASRFSPVHRDHDRPIVPLLKSHRVGRNFRDWRGDCGGH